MLARLDTDLTPLRASVDREGTLLRIEGPDQAEVAARVVRIVNDIGYLAEPIETAPPVSRWFGGEAVDQLSQEEARVLAERWVSELGSEGIVEEPRLLFDPLMADLLDAMRFAASTGSIDVAGIGLPSLRHVLNEDDAERVRRWIRRKLGQHTPD